MHAIFRCSFALLMLAHFLTAGCQLRPRTSTVKSSKNVDILFPTFETILLRKGVTVQLTPKGAVALSMVIEKRKTQLDDLRKSTRNEDQKDELKQVKKFLIYAKKLARIALKFDQDKGVAEEAYVLAKRILHSIYVNDPQYNHRPIRYRLRAHFKVIARILGKYHTFRAPYRDVRELDHPVGKIQGKRESRLLFNGDGNRILPSVYKDLSSRQLTHLDISRHHPMWNTKKWLKLHPEPWRDLEEWANREVTKRLRKKRKHLDPLFHYDLRRVHDVFFFRGMKTSATAPKVKVEDCYGVNWKLKWGDEVQSEVVANRLYMAAGGKFTDLVYAKTSAADPVMMILDSPTTRTQEKGCHPVTVKDLIQCLRNSKYRFNLKPFILDSGIIDETNVDRLPTSRCPLPKKRYRRARLLGRTWVRFREALVEFRSNKIIDRGGPSPSSTVGSQEDRVNRGLYLFNMWINNKDAKDDNNRSLLLKNYRRIPLMAKIGNSRRSFDQYVELQHDLGFSFGGFMVASSLNMFATGSLFMRHAYGFKQIIFPQISIFAPKSWSKATFSDLRWMAIKISAISRSQITTIVARTHWPDFMQRTLVYKLLKRRNRIAKFFHTEEWIDTISLPTLNFEVPLRTADEQKQAAVRYKLPLKKIEEELAKVRSEGTFVDQIVRKGRLANCQETILIGLLEEAHYPSGLGLKRTRFNDHLGRIQCRYHMLSKHFRLQQQWQEQIQRQDQEQIQDQEQDQEQDQKQEQEQAQGQE